MWQRVALFKVLPLVSRLTFTQGQTCVRLLGVAYLDVAPEHAELTQDVPSPFFSSIALTIQLWRTPSPVGQVGWSIPQLCTVTCLCLARASWKKPRKPAAECCRTSQPVKALWEKLVLPSFCSVLFCSFLLYRDDFWWCSCSFLSSQVSDVMSQIIVQKLNGLQVLSPLLSSNKVNLQRSAMGLVGNLTKNPNLHNAIGKTGL